MISYDDFTKLNIKIGTIISAEIVEDADKLLRLTVDLGEQEENGDKKLRQIISGIREWFPEPETLVGRQCPFLANLETRVIRGFASEGMILAGSDNDTFALLQPHIEVKPGAKVK